MGEGLEEWWIVIGVEGGECGELELWRVFGGVRVY